jgi:hypothetical protein
VSTPSPAIGRRTFLFRAGLVMAGLRAGAVAAEAAAPGRLWILDNNLEKGRLPPDARDVFLKPEAWARARRHLGVYYFRVHELSENGIYTDDYLKNHLIPVLKQSGVAIGLETWGALWSQGTLKNRPGLTRGEYFRGKDTALIRRIHSLGGTVEYINLLSVLSKTPPPGVWENCGPYETCDAESITRRALDIAAYVRALRQEFPGMKIGELDSLIRFPQWRDGSGYRQAVEILAREGVKLDFWIVDLPFEIPHLRTWGITWADLVRAQNIVRENPGCLFGVVLASRISSAQRHAGESPEPGRTAAEQTHLNTLRFIDEFHAAGGRPDIWFSNLYFPEPARLLPDDDPAVYSQMRTLREAGEKLACGRSS